MKLRVSLIVLVLIWVSQSSYCQYPQKRVFRGDSVVILSITQADTINKLYKSYNDSIQLLNNTITIKNKKYDSIYKAIHRKQDSINIWQGKYQTSVDLFRLRPKARSYEAEEKLDFAQKIILIIIILVQFNSLK
jgi:hypothetical protein